MYSLARKLIFAGLTAALTLATAACSTSPKYADTAPSVAIDVKAELLDKGFTENQITEDEKDAAYTLAPFQIPTEMSENPVPGNATCTFGMVSMTYPEGASFDGHAIRSDTVVRLTAFLFGNDARKGPMLRKTPVVPFAELTPNWFAEHAEEFGGLEVCGNLTVGQHN